MTLTIDEELLGRARKLEPVIREHSDRAERERRVPKPVIESMRKAELFRMLTPRSLGGLETDPVTCARVIEEVASFDSAAGWTLMTANSADWWCARLPTEGAEELYADDPDAIIAASFHPPQQATPARGGYRLTGRGPLASNIHEAKWLMFTAVVMDDDQPRMIGGVPEVIALIVRAEEAEIIDTWYTLGMRGTDSNDVAVKDVFVPAARTFPLVPTFEPGSHYGGPLYRLPGMAEVGVVISPVCMAMAREAITEFVELARGKTPFGSAKPLRERAAAQMNVGKAEAFLRSARLLFYDTLGEAWDRSQKGETFSLERRADLLLAAVHAIAASARAVELVHRTAGTSGIYSRSRLERHFRDIQVLRHHGFTSETRYETVGQVYLGVPPEYGMVAF